MYFKKIIFTLTLFLLYQIPLYSKSASFNDLNSKNLSKYFSGIVALENNDNSSALDFFRSSKILLHKHDPYLKRYVSTLVHEGKVSQAVNVIKQNLGKKNTNFFDAYLLLILDSLKKDNFDQANIYLSSAFEFSQKERFNSVILHSLKQYIFLFKEKKILENKRDLGKLDNISETFQRCYLEDPRTDVHFSNLINDNETDFSRYTYFYLTYLVEQNRLADANEIIDDIEFIDTSLLLSQGKSWIENKNQQKLSRIFSCKNHNDLLSEFLFLISNLYSSEDNFQKSNYYLNLSNFLNPKFIFNLSLLAENYYFNKEYDKTKKILKKFKKEDKFYHWYRIKKEAQIIEKQRNKKESLNYIIFNFKKIINPNEKILFDIANFYKNSKEYKEAIKYYSIVLESLENNSEIKSDLLYRRGGSYERLGNYERADKDLLMALKLNTNDAYILNYLAYSWLERKYKIDEAIKMLEIAYESESDDPYIIDSIGWAYYLIDDYLTAEKFLRRAVRLMPNDPIVNDHYADILWKLDRKIQARYFWTSVLKMDDAEKDMKESIQKKLIDGLKSS